ncbi:hypothetical protein DPMN_084895 [Dreissena polymorpha]|uniref:Uncharacterized protein n=1 Tax=Dreissena polymorpha TaxID=45954 RepID=A0A9D3YF36_DREPO|nr:hypothetical protein DPMN_084895 [Dreissena polymorpha]
MKNSPPSGCHSFQQTGTIFQLIQDTITQNVCNQFNKNWSINVTFKMLRKNSILILIQDIIDTNIATRFHEDPTINVASYVLTRLYLAIYRKMPCPPVAMFFQPTEAIFALLQNIIETNLLTKFHEDWPVNVISRVLRRSEINVASRELTRKNALPPWWPYIIGTNLLKKFHEDPWSLEC